MDSKGYRHQKVMCLERHKEQAGRARGMRTDRWWAFVNFETGIAHNSYVQCKHISVMQRGVQRKILWNKCTKDIRNPHCSSQRTVYLRCWSVLYRAVFKLCLFSFSAPLTDKPPKILFPSENKINNMELQLGKSIMGFPPAAVSNICVISKWQEMDDFTNPLPTHLQALNTDWWWHFANSKREEKIQQL